MKARDAGKLHVQFVQERTEVSARAIERASSDPTVHAGAGIALPSSPHPLTAILVASDRVDAVVAADGDVLLGDRNRVKRTTFTTHTIHDEAAIALVRNTKRISIATNSATAGINESLVGDAAGPRQFKRTAVINGSLDQFIIKEGGNVGPKLGIPLLAGGLGIGLLLGSDGVGVEGLVERECRTMHHQGVVTVDAEELFVLACTSDQGGGRAS